MQRSPSIDQLVRSMSRQDLPVSRNPFAYMGSGSRLPYELKPPPPCAGEYGVRKAENVVLRPTSAVRSLRVQEPFPQKLQHVAPADIVPVKEIGTRPGSAVRAYVSTRSNGAILYQARAIAITPARRPGRGHSMWHPTQMHIPARQLLAVVCATAHRAPFRSSSTRRAAGRRGSTRKDGAGDAKAGRRAAAYPRSSQGRGQPRRQRRPRGRTGIEAPCGPWRPAGCWERVGPRPTVRCPRCAPRTARGRPVRRGPGKPQRSPRDHFRVMFFRVRPAACSTSELRVQCGAGAE